MLITALIIGVSLIVGATLIAKYWNKIFAFLKNVVNAIKFKLKRLVLGTKVFMKRIGDKFQTRTKNYSKDEETKKWKETIVTCNHNEEEIPDEYKNINYATMPGDEFEITKDGEKQLELQTQN
jgi:hypothetical protein